VKKIGTGNPAGVIVLKSNHVLKRQQQQQHQMAMTLMTMQTIANELNISETAFVMDTKKQNNISNNNNLISITMKFPIVVIFYVVKRND
jgi:predicted PhzF superfamily epimerase YddE/YHI9